MMGYDGLDSSVYPFSWHERLPNQKVEDVKLTSFRPRGYFQKRFPKELETLAKILDSNP
jgi:hypothetical protein